MKLPPDCDCWDACIHHVIGTATPAVQVTCMVGLAKPTMRWATTCQQSAQHVEAHCEFHVISVHCDSSSHLSKLSVPTTCTLIHRYVWVLRAIMLEISLWSCIVIVLYSVLYVPNTTVFHTKIATSLQKLFAYKFLLLSVRFIICWICCFLQWGILDASDEWCIRKGWWLIWAPDNGTLTIIQ